MHGTLSTSSRVGGPRRLWNILCLEAYTYVYICVHLYIYIYMYIYQTLFWIVSSFLSGDLGSSAGEACGYNVHGPALQEKAGGEQGG